MSGHDRDQKLNWEGPGDIWRMELCTLYFLAEGGFSRMILVVTMIPT